MKLLARSLTFAAAVWMAEVSMVAFAIAPDRDSCTCWTPLAFFFRTPDASSAPETVLSTPEAARAFFMDPARFSPTV